MNESQLRDAIKEAVALLVAIDQAIPDKVDGALVRFLQEAEANDFTLTLLHRALSALRTPQRRAV